MDNNEDETNENYANLTLSSFLEALSAPTPVPGGGSASAVGIALAAALAGMVAGLSGTDPRWASLKAETARLQAEALQLAEEDARAFAGVMQAVRLPKTTEDEQRQRRAALVHANAEAAAVPLRTSATGLAVLQLALRAAEEGNPRAISDAGVAGELALAGLRGAALNVRINLPSLPEEERGKILARLEPLELEAETAITGVRKAVSERMKA